MAEAVTVPLLVAAAVLVVAGAAKLRAPSGAVRALALLRVPLVRDWGVRGFALAEVALGVSAFVSPSPLVCGAIGGLYATFSVVTLLLARAQASCGCFGADGSPASAGQSLISAALGTVAVLAAAAGAHGLEWVLHRSVSAAAVLLLGIVGSVYGAVIAYTEVPSAWAAWSGR